MIFLFLTFFKFQEIRLDSSWFQSSYGEFSVKVGEPLSIEIKLINDSARTFKNIRLYLDYYQDFQNSQLNRTQNQNIDEKIIVNGCDSFRLDKVSFLEGLNLEFFSRSHKLIYDAIVS